MTVNPNIDMQRSWGGLLTEGLSANKPATPQTITPNGVAMYFATDTGVLWIYAAGMWNSYENTGPTGPTGSTGATGATGIGLQQIGNQDYLQYNTTKSFGNGYAGGPVVPAPCAYTATGVSCIIPAAVPTATLYAFLYVLSPSNLVPTTLAAVSAMVTGVTAGLNTVSFTTPYSGNAGDILFFGFAVGTDTIAPVATSTPAGSLYFPLADGVAPGNNPTSLVWNGEGQIWQSHSLNIGV